LVAVVEQESTTLMVHQPLQDLLLVVVLRDKMATGPMELWAKDSAVEQQAVSGTQVVAVELEVLAQTVVVEAELLVVLDCLVLLRVQLFGLVEVAVLLVTQKELAMAVVAEAAVADTGLLEDLELETQKE
jgi:hypothetical protein